MKKLLAVTIILLAFMLTGVSIYADSGLNSTWYQKKGVEEDNEDSGKFSEFLGKDTDPEKNWTSNRDTLFENLEEKGKIVVDTFEVPNREDATDFYDNAESAGVVMVGNAEWMPDYVVVKYTGFIVAKETGEYQFKSSYVDNGFVCYIDDKNVFEFWGSELWLDDGKVGTHEGTAFTMEANKAYAFEAYYMEEHGGDVLLMDVVFNGSEKAFADSGLFLFTAQPTDVELENVKNGVTPTPTPAPATPTPATPTPTKSATLATQAPSAPVATEGSEFPVIPVAIGAVVLVAIAAVVVVILKKKKK